MMIIITLLMTLCLLFLIRVGLLYLIAYLIVYVVSMIVIIPVAKIISVMLIVVITYAGMRLTLEITIIILAAIKSRRTGESIAQSLNRMSIQNRNK